MTEYPRRQFLRLRLIANNTWVMAANLRHLSANWQETLGHSLELVEAFVGPKRFAGTLYRTGN